ncbi:heat shock 70 kDa protein 14-like [Macrosteles quadrilineatus]|uniref:heat shock 70 kDa protein 14-like n=1 Tax=Macrosteles quadrilineatus TaxID=74068 RepID=UPI0023E13AD1|nr:heat shock 70 kDa protein 14-like [Macrosteles quadrilineatus]
MFGIHIGNTNASIAYCKENGEVSLITNESGDRQTSTIVTFTDEGIITFGDTAQKDMSKTITHNKSAMASQNLNGDTFHNQVETRMENNIFSYCIPQKGNIQYVTPQDIMVLILKQLLASAKSALGVKNDCFNCVLLMPESFPEEYCKNYKTAAEEAGWKVIQVINEASAAVLAYSLLDYEDKLSETIIVYRLGGTTCEITGSEISKGMVTIIGSTYKEDIGGNLFTDVLANYLADQFVKKYKLDPRERRRSFEKLKLEAKNCVNILSNLPTVTCLIESLHEGLDLSVNLSRARFELIIKPTLERCIEPLRVFIKEFELNGSIDKVVLCGGGVNVPSLKHAVSSLFDGTTTEVLAHCNSEEVLAKGGAKQAYYLSQAKYDYSEMLPRSMDVGQPVEVENAELVYDVY